MSWLENITITYKIVLVENPVRLKVVQIAFHRATCYLLLNHYFTKCTRG